MGGAAGGSGAGLVCLIAFWLLLLMRNLACCDGLMSVVGNMVPECLQSAAYAVHARGGPLRGILHIHRLLSRALACHERGPGHCASRSSRHGGACEAL